MTGRGGGDGGHQEGGEEHTEARGGGHGEGSGCAELQQKAHSVGDGRVWWACPSGGSYTDWCRGRNECHCLCRPSCEPPRHGRRPRFLGGGLARRAAEVVCSHCGQLRHPYPRLSTRADPVVHVNRVRPSPTGGGVTTGETRGGPRWCHQGETADQDHQSDLAPTRPPCSSCPADAEFQGEQAEGAATAAQPKTPSQESRGSRGLRNLPPRQWRAHCVAVIPSGPIGKVQGCRFTACPIPDSEEAVSHVGDHSDRKGSPPQYGHHESMQSPYSPPYTAEFKTVSIKSERSACVYQRDTLANHHRALCVAQPLPTARSPPPPDPVGQSAASLRRWQGGGQAREKDPRPPPLPRLVKVALLGRGFTQRVRNLGYNVQVSDWSRPICYAPDGGVPPFGLPLPCSRSPVEVRQMDDTVGSRTATAEDITAAFDETVWAYQCVACSGFFLKQSTGMSLWREGARQSAADTPQQRIASLPVSRCRRDTCNSCYSRHLRAAHPTAAEHPTPTNARPSQFGLKYGDSVSGQRRVRCWLSLVLSGAAATRTGTAERAGGHRGRLCSCCASACA
ncbi:hypothetical protein BU14_0483s0001 [Porphyra umbilicalis]|uniref:Uncharacterized protein n=1 Tax=Porphyra umbilicalis TaxID=2786 RepID=A0A1X6NTQ5_PORUM|nr:hypothetical protein BU14_0483s0001 [Porphyra umbilicalis]|eukprot:OSX71988.1 hypothetical protein BU14_0483s0001 [Porphyra umbilicalis]